MVKAAANQGKQGMSHGFNAVLGIKSTKTIPLQLVECGAENGDSNNIPFDMGS
jgi:hypothetical protein